MPTPDRPLRLLAVVTTSDVGGTEGMLVNLATRLDPARVAVEVCSLCTPGRAGKTIADAGFPVHSLDMPPSVPVWQLPAILLGTIHLAKIFDEAHDGEGYDLVHGLLYRANVMAGLAARRATSKPPVLCGQRSLAAMRGRLPAMALRITRGACTMTEAVSEAVKARMVDEGVDPAVIEVIGNGVDAERFHPGDRADRNHAGARRALALPGDDGESILVGAVGRLATTKRYDLLIDAVAEARQRGADLRLVLVGDGPEREALEAQAKQQLGDRAHFLGRRGDIPDILPALDVFALTSREEGSPNALLEAMACGCAVISTEVGGVPEIVTDGVDGLLVPSGDRDAIADALLRLTEDGELWTNLGLAARRRIEERFALTEILRRYENLYRRVAGWDA
ncbi:MAG: glycosyltransferase [Acidobacteriota bacterium]